MPTTPPILTAPSPSAAICDSKPRKDKRRPSAITSSRRANPVKALLGFGQSVWLDDLRRNLFTSGEFRRLIGEDGLRGATSNPSTFEKAIAGSADYLEALREIDGLDEAEPKALYEALAIRDIRDAAGTAPSGVRRDVARGRLRELRGVALPRARH